MEKPDYKVDLGNIECRRARRDDNMEEIAELIYQTDPYLYPYWFENSVENAKNFLKDKIFMDGFVFNYENCYVAYDKSKNKIVGLVVAFDTSVNFDYDYTPYINLDERNKNIIEKYLFACIDDVRNEDSNFLYIMNCAVLEECRGQGIGRKLLGHFIGNMEKAGFNVFMLDCLLHNLRAKNLYHSLGFKEMEETKGFTYVSPVELVVFKRHEGDYLPDEFQKKENYKDLSNLF